MRIARPVPPAVSNPDRERPGDTRDGILDMRSAHVTGPAHPGAGEEAAVALGHLHQGGRRIGDAVDPVSSARKRDVAVRVHHPRDDRCPRGVDDLRPRPGIGLLAGSSHPLDAALPHQDAHPQAKRLGAPVGEGTIAEEDRAARHGLAHYRHPGGDPAPKRFPTPFPPWEGYVRRDGGCDGLAPHLRDAGGGHHRGRSTPSASLDRGGVGAVGLALHPGVAPPGGVAGTPPATLRPGRRGGLSVRRCRSRGRSAGDDALGERAPLPRSTRPPPGPRPRPNPAPTVR